jgi:pSer/pThr/pTyr-binding forkhead associated (FHA) protein
VPTTERQITMEHTCPVCSKPYDGVFCTACTTAENDLGKKSDESAEKNPTAYLVDLVSNRKIPVPTPRCKAGRDDLNDIVISGDQSISRFHFVITKEADQFSVQDSKSRHGTFLNGNQISNVEPINDGDVLKVGVSLFWFVIESPSALSLPEGTPPVDMRVPVKPVKSVEIHTDSIQAKGRPADKTTATSTDIPALTPESLAAMTPAGAAKFAHMDFQERTIPPNDAVQHGMLLNPTEIEDHLDEILKETKLDSEEKPSEKATQKTANDEQFDKTASDLEDISKKYQESEFNRFGGDETFAKELTIDQFETKSETESNSERKSEAKSDSETEKAKEPETPSKEEAVEVKSDEDKWSEKGSESSTIKAEHEDESAKEESGSTSTTLGKFAEIIDEAASQKDLRSEIEKHESEQESELANIVTESLQPSAESEAEHEEEAEIASAEEVSKDGHGLASGNGAKSVMSIVKESIPGTVPEWCSKYFAGELNQLSRELGDLNDQVRMAQQKIRDVESRVALLKGLRNTLLVSTGEELVEACGKVLTFLGWRVKVSDDDNQELKLDWEDRLSLARVVWTSNQAERTHLGQLSISQTRYWCEQGAEPKGILIISRVGDQPPAPLTSNDYNSDIADHASRKNICLMTTVQLLAIYRDVVINGVSADEVRGKIASTSGWLNGYNLEQGTAGGDKEEGGTNKLSSLLSA